VPYGDLPKPKYRIYHTKTVATPGWGGYGSLGKVVSYTYDATGNQTSVSYPDGTTATKTYDLLGQLKTVTEHDGRTTTYTYDGMGRTVKMEYPHGWVEDYHYDSIGQLLKVEDTDPSGKDMKQQKHVYQYDDCGSMTCYKKMKEGFILCQVIQNLVRST